MMTLLNMTLPLTQPVAIFMSVMVIILCAPLIFSRLKIPNIVGMILAGVAVGPYGFNILARDASFEIFGEVGILYLMFLAAIDIDMYHLRKNYRSGLFYGILTFLLPMCLGIPVTHYILGLGWDSSVLVSSMYASHTLISYPVVSKFGLSNNRAAVIAVTGTIVAVLLALFALAEVVAIKQTGAFHISGLLRMLLMMIVYALGVGYSFPYFTRKFFRKFSEPVAQFIFILTLVCLSSLLARVIGLEAILGAFYAGLVLNRYIPGRSALKSRITFVGNALFIPYFLIGVGMLINVRIIFSGWTVIIAAVVMTLTALSMKWLSAYISAKAGHINADGRRLMFGLSSGKAAATIAATMIGYKYGLLSEDMMNGAVMMILICCIVASVVTENAAKSIRIALTAEELDVDGPKPVGFARQIVAVSNPLTADGIMRTAIFMRNPENDEPVAAVYVRNDDNRPALVAGREALERARNVAESMEVECVEINRFDLNIPAGLTNILRERDASEIVIGLHRRSNIVDSFFGSMIEQLMRSTKKMIIISRCFIPIDTIGKIIVYTPKNAEYETGFGMWLARVANLASQLGCDVTFLCYPATAEHIETRLREGGYSFRHIYNSMENWDDFIILSSQVGVEDLLIVIGARKGSVSHSADYDNMPSFLSRNFAHANLTLILPEQFGG